MPNVYRRKSSRGTWSHGSMIAAANAVRNGMSLYGASVEYGVPRNTLRARVNGDAAKKAYEKPCVLGAANEKALVDRIIYLQRLGFGLTITDVRRLAFDFVQKSNIHCSLFNADKKTAGWDWYRAFMQRHPEITVRLTQNISHARAQCMNRPMVDTFFNMYEQEVDNLLLRTSPHAIYNADETGLQLHLRPGKVLAAKGDKSVLQVTNSERGQNVTVMACCNAVGNFIPPMVIFKGVRCKPEFADGAPPGSLIEMSESGYISADLFLSWLKHFNRYRLAGNCILIVDGHASHVKSLEVLDYANENNITLICLPPHTTHYLQPLDRSFFKPLKVYYDQACRSFISNHPGRSITKLQFSTLLNQAWGKAATTETGTNGFRICGIYPVNRQAIPEHAYAPSGVSEISAFVSTSQEAATPTVAENVVSGNSSAAADQQMSQKVSSVSAEETDGVLSASLISGHQNSITDEHEPTTDTSSAVVPGFVCQDGPVDNIGACSPTGDTDSDCVGSPGGLQGRSEPCTSDATSPASVTFRDLHPTPKIIRTVKTGDGRRQAAAVLTSPSYRKALFDKTSTKCSKIPKKKKQTCRQNKKRGRKPQGDKRKTKQPCTTTTTPSSANKKGEEDVCVNCGYVYGDYDDPLIDDPWFKCGKCGRWGHESCGNVAHRGLFCCAKCE